MRSVKDYGWTDTDQSYPIDAPPMPKRGSIDSDGDTNLYAPCGDWIGYLYASSDHWDTDSPEEELLRLMAWHVSKGECTEPECQA